MYRSWDTDSDEEAAMPQDLYQKIREKLGEANEIISVDKKPDQEMPKLKLVYLWIYQESPLRPLLS